MPPPPATPEVTHAARPPSAFRSPAAHARFWLVALIGLAIDLYSKHWAFATLGQGGQRVLIPPIGKKKKKINKEL